MQYLQHLLNVIMALATRQSQLVTENMALKQQIIVLKRTTKRASITDSDRMFWVLMRRLHKGWKNQLFIVKPETVTRWHRQGYRYYWRWKSRAKRGRPPIPMKLIWLIKRLSRENPLWGAPRIEEELTLLGHQIGETSVSKYMIRFRKDPSPSWRTFLSNHMTVAAACDFFVVPTLAFKMLYCFVVLSHDRRHMRRQPSCDRTTKQ